MVRVSPVNPPTSELGEAVVTGASEGIGEAFARELAARGYDLLLIARRVERLEGIAADLRSKHGRTIRVLRADLATAEGVNATSHAAFEGGRVPTLLVNNAGFGLVADTLDSDESRLVEMMRLNMEAVMVLSHRFGRAMYCAGRGGIINVASTAAFQACPGFGTYAATKAFVLSFTEALHHELGQRVQVLALCPGYTISGFHRVAGLNESSMRFRPMTAETVVDEALNALRLRRPFRVCGIANYITALAVRVLPRRWVRVIAARLFRN